jgi:hypothetical protein
MLKERAIRVGKPVPLVGVVSEPAALDPSRPALLVLNSGIMHHVGACRLSVKIARAVAEHGLLAARFDFSSIGDSEPRRGTLSVEEAAIAEMREVMDYLQRTRGMNRFIIYGLCSGADCAFNIAQVDERVIGIVQLDAYCYRTWRYYVEYYLPLLFRGARWRSFLRRGVQRLRGKRLVKTASEAAGIDEQYLEIPRYTRVFPPQATVADGLRTLTARGVKMYVNFTGGEANYNYTGQYRDSFRDVNFKDLLRVDYYPQTNHIVTQPDQQRRIVDNISQWVASVAAAPAAKASAKKEPIKSVA